MSLRYVSRAGALGLVAAVAFATTSSITDGSAAQLIISDPGVVQYWELSLHLEPPAPEPVVACGAPADYAGVLRAEPGTPLVAPDPPKGQNKGWILVGTDADDVLIGANKSDCLVGLGGDDVLRGANGSDLLIGGQGDDTLHGGNGKDTLDPGGQPGDVCADLETNETCVGVPPEAPDVTTEGQ